MNWTRNRATNELISGGYRIVKVGRQFCLYVGAFKVFTGSLKACQETAEELQKTFSGKKR